MWDYSVNKTFELTENTYAAIKGVMATILGFDKPHEVIVRPMANSLSARQRRLYFKWVGIVAHELGYEKEELHEQYKALHLIPIYRAREDGEFEKDLQAANKLYALGETEAFSRMKDHIIRKTSITEATTKEMAQYMDIIYKHAGGELGLKLPTPDELYI